jgi:hypothetical protein
MSTMLAMFAVMVMVMVVLLACGRPGAYERQRGCERNGQNGLLEGHGLHLLFWWD